MNLSQIKPKGVLPSRYIPLRVNKSIGFIITVFVKIIGLP